MIISEFQQKLNLISNLLINYACSYCTWDLHNSEYRDNSAVPHWVKDIINWNQKDIDESR